MHYVDENLVVPYVKYDTLHYFQVRFHLTLCERLDLQGLCQNFCHFSLNIILIAKSKKENENSGSEKMGLVLY